MNRSQRRKLGQRGPLLPREERVAQRDEVGAPEINHLTTLGMRWHAWDVTWATAHLFPERCREAFLENPGWWWPNPMHTVTKNVIKARQIPACIECIQNLVAVRNQAMMAEQTRAVMLDARYERRRLRVGAAA